MPEEIERIAANRNKKAFLARKVVIITIIFAVVAAIVSGGLYLLVNAQQKGLLVNDRLIDTDTYAALVKQSEDSGATPEDATATIARATKVDQIAKDVGIDVSQPVLDDRSVIMFGKDWDQLSDWQKQKVKVSTLIDTASFNAVGGYEAYVLNVPFSENYGLYLDNIRKSPAEIESARRAALTKATEVASRLRAKPENVNEIIRELRTEKPYSDGYGFSTNLSRPLYMTEQGEVYEEGDGMIVGELDAQTITTLKGLAVGQVTDPVLESANLVSESVPSDDMYYNKVLPIAYRVFYLKSKVQKSESQYEKIMQRFNEIKVTLNE